MEILKEYETKSLGFLIADLFSPVELNKIVRECELVSYDYTGAGYFLEVFHAGLPERSIVRDNPIVMGEAKGITVGFVVFIENRRLCFECHSWSEKAVPQDFGDYDVSVKAGKFEDGNFIELNQSD